MDEAPPEVEAEYSGDSAWKRAANAIRFHWPKSTWAVPEIAAVALVLLAVFAAVDNLVALAGFGSIGGVKGTIADWTYWSTDPLAAVMLLVAVLVSWYEASQSSTVLEAVGSPPAVSGEEDMGLEPWNRIQRGHVVALLAGLCGLITGLAVIVFVVIAWPGSHLSIGRHLDVVAGGIGPAIGAAATVVIAWKVHHIWRSVAYEDDTVEESSALPT